MNYYGTAITPANRRNVIRRNYRWLRSRGVSREIARIIIDSSILVGLLSAWETR